MKVRFSLHDLSIGRAMRLASLLALLALLALPAGFTPKGRTHTSRHDSQDVDARPDKRSGSLVSPLGNSTKSVAEIENLLLGHRLNAAGEVVQQQIAWQHASFSRRRHGDDNVEAAPEEYRWSHAGLTELLALSEDPRRDLRLALRSDNEVVRTMGHIGLGRLEPNRHHRDLRSIADNRMLPVDLRRATIETLARSNKPAVRQTLDGLLEKYGAFAKQADGEPRHDASRQPADARNSVYQAGLHVELLRGLDRHLESTEDGRYLAALASPAPAVRLEVLDLWAAKRDVPLPAEVGKLMDRRQPLLVRLKVLQLWGARRGVELSTPVVDLLGDGHSQIRAAGLRAMVGRRHPDALDALVKAVHDVDLTVKLTAIEELGRLGGEEARQKLRDLADNQPERLREAAVSALALAGDKAAVYAAAEDEFWRVRRAVAEALKNDHGGRARAVAQKLLADRSGEVRLRMVQSLALWPNQQAIALLLEAAQASDWRGSKAAIVALQEKWPPAANFPLQAPAQRRAEAVDKLKKSGRRKFSTSRIQRPADLPMIRRPPRTRQHHTL